MDFEETWIRIVRRMDLEQLWLGFVVIAIGVFCLQVGIMVYLGRAYEELKDMKEMLLAYLEELSGAFARRTDSDPESEA